MDGELIRRNGRRTDRMEWAENGRNGRRTDQMEWTENGLDGMDG